MIEGDRAYRREATQVVFIRVVVTVPRHHIERRMRQRGLEQFTAPFDEQRVGGVLVLVRRNRREEIAWIGETIGADRPAIRQGEAATVIFADIGARRAVDQSDTEDHAARNDADLAGADRDDAEFRAEGKRSLLRDDQHFAVGVEKALLLHRVRDEQHMGRHADMGLAVAGRRDSTQPGDEGEFFRRDRRWSPAQLRDRHLALALRRGSDQSGVDALEAAGVANSRAYTIEPGALVYGLRRGEGRAG